jgi:hypothetical protein
MTKRPSKPEEEIERILQNSNLEGRDRKFRIPGAKISKSGQTYSQDDFKYEGPNESMDSLQVSRSFTCDFGHYVDQKIRLVARCEVCDRLTCETVNCSLNCTNCGKALCRKHASLYADEEVYCRRCRPIKWLKIFFGVQRKEREK